LETERNHPSELITRSATSKEENNVNGRASTFSRSSSLWRLQMQLQHFPSPRILLFFLLSQYNNQLKLMTIEKTDWFDLIYAAIVDWSKLFDEIDQVHFNLFLQHHCRCCGRTLCHEHSSNYLVCRFFLSFPPSLSLSLGVWQSICSFFSIFF